MRVGSLPRQSEKPYSVLLFDEIEKAHHDVFNIFLQILDEGRLTDSQGRTVDFKNTVIIMTSNIGSMYLLEGVDNDGELKPKAVEAVNEELKRHFRPEFLNRVDDVVFFKPLQKEQIRKIIDLIFEQLAERLKDRNIKISLSENAKEYIISSSYDPVYGARPLKRFIQRKMETSIGRALIAGEINDGDDILIDADEKELKFKKLA